MKRNKKNDADADCPRRADFRQQFSLGKAPLE